jgi:hypothetical protein
MLAAKDKVMRGSSGIKKRSGGEREMKLTRF